MVSIHLEKTSDAFVLRVAGLLDGSAAWRIVRLALRLGRASARRPDDDGPRVLIDLSSVDRLMTFAASVFAVGLPRAGARVVAVRPAHRRLLIAEGVIPADAETLQA